MLNHLIEVVLQSIWSSLTGGWFYDPHLSIFINTVHMYTWIILFFLPFFFYLVSKILKFFDCQTNNLILKNKFKFYFLSYFRRIFLLG